MVDDLFLEKSCLVFLWALLQAILENVLLAFNMSEATAIFRSSG
jgi:hypothetical protein